MNTITNADRYRVQSEIYIFHELAMTNRIELQPSLVEAWYEICDCEGYCAALRRSNSVLQTSYHTILPQAALPLSIKRIKVNIRPKYLIPSILLYSKLPTLLVFIKSLPDQKRRMPDMTLDCSELAMVTAKLRTPTTLKFKLRSATNIHVKSNYEILLCIEKERNRCGPVMVCSEIKYRNYRNRWTEWETLRNMACDPVSSPYLQVGC